MLQSLLLRQYIKPRSLDIVLHPLQRAKQKEKTWLGVVYLGLFLDKRQLNFQTI